MGSLSRAIPFDANPTPTSPHHACTIAMPRVATALLRKAYTIDPVLPALLAPCRDIHAAKNELRWLREHVEEEFTARRVRDDAIARKARLRQLVRERNRGKPLQYILGTEYFADLEIQCRPGVLIPRYVRRNCTHPIINISRVV
jgi:hypothetical protein